jgi:hypothetical protein
MGVPGATAATGLSGERARGSRFGFVRAFAASLALFSSLNYG